MPILKRQVWGNAKVYRDVMSEAKANRPAHPPQGGKVRSGRGMMSSTEITMRA
jgi:hypothetical protein